MNILKPKFPLEILKFPHPMLSHKCRDVYVFESELSLLLEAMYTSMIAAKGLGLSANQCGLDLNAFVMTGPNDTKLFIVNPEIVKRSEVPANLVEACLSAPGESVVLAERVQWVQLSYQDENGNRHRKTFLGIYAVCVEHEMDHLAGRSFLQSKSIPKTKRKEFAKKYGK